MDLSVESRSASAENTTINPLRVMTTRRKTLVVLCLAVNTILLNMCVSVVGPVFPIELRKIHPRHDTAAGFATGLVFSVATISDFLSAPLIGREMPRIGAKRTFGLGAFLVSVLMILFSFVSELYEWGTFLGFCYAIRIFQGFGTAMVFVSTFALLAGTFPDRVASVSGMLEVFTGLGFMLGPALGGVLYQYGGFKAPFLTVGCMLLLGTIAIQLVLPEPEQGNQKEGSFPASTVCCEPRVFLMLLVAFWSCAALAFFDPTLGIFLHEGFHLSPSQVGACFLIGPFIYMVVSPFIGVLADKFSRKPLIPAGCFICTLGYELMGPEVVFGVKKQLGMALVGYAIIGVGVSFASVPVSADILETMHNKGYLDTPELHGAIGGLFGAAFSLGATIGPLIGGTLSGSFNLGDATALFGLLYVVLGAIVVVQTTVEYFVVKRGSGSKAVVAADRIPLTMKQVS